MFFWCKLKMLAHKREEDWKINEARTVKCGEEIKALGKRKAFSNLGGAALPNEMVFHLHQSQV